jgi:Raf kinase inhibitor-like YbhB/YbcL family protein
LPFVGTGRILRDDMREARTGTRRQAAPAAAAALAALSIVLGACAPGGSSSASPTSSAAAGATPTFTPEASIMATPSTTPAATTLSLVSPAFVDGDPIPREYSCSGEDVSPALAWQGVPPGTAALVLFVDDPDGGNWVHWTILDLPGADGGLPRGVSPAADAPQQGRNDFRKPGYGGPCPPSGNHHYRFTLYALAAPLGLTGHPDGATVRTALGNATVLGQVTLVGTFRA